MTVEALSPPNRMQSLRERLIQEGSIKPKNSESNQSKSNQLVLKTTQDKVFTILESYYSISELDKKLARFFALLEESLGGTSQIDGTPNAGVCNYASVLEFLNIYRLLKNLIKNNNIFTKVVSVVRTGFFFAFKENMRNTP